ncbi:kinetochore protein Nuf2-like [Notamacropus eugenii]|uniref:kinetochore protein Nuf2-like n=1 Tax=Notamacropus eugenii TaxID=9315 RepID=UPI003B66DFA8
MDKMQQLQVAQEEASMKLEQLDSVLVEEQAEFKQLLQDIDGLQQTLNEFHEITACSHEPGKSDGGTLELCGCSG